jgi:hypothetical protein
MGRWLGAGLAVALLVAGCEAGAVGQPPSSPPEPPAEVVAPPAPPPPKAPPPEPLPPSEGRPAEAAGAPQRPDRAASPHDAPAAPPAPPTWRRVDIVEMSVELPMPITTGTFDNGGPWAGSRLGPLDLSAGEMRVVDDQAFVTGAIRGHLKNSPGTVVKREAKRVGKDGTETTVVIDHVNGARTLARYFHVRFDNGSGWLFWQLAIDESGRSERPETERFIDSARPVPLGAPSKPKPQKR